MAINKTQTTLNTAAPSTTQEEHLSALFDGEVGAFEERRLIDELQSSSDLRHKLSSYALIGETMRSDQASIVLGSSFLDSIHEKIETDDEYHEVQLEEPRTSTQKSVSWLRPVGGFAMAASVAAVAVLGFQNYQQTPSNIVTTPSPLEKPQSNPQQDQIATANSDAIDGLVASVEVSGYEQADLRTRMLLKKYVDIHVQEASTSSFVPSVRVIAYAD